MSQDAFLKVRIELQHGMAQTKCRSCGCMKEGLEQVVSIPEAPQSLKEEASLWLEQMEPIRYPCLGCQYCYPAVTANLLSEAFPSAEVTPAECGMRVAETRWPPVAGEYFVTDPAAHVAVTTLASVDLARALSENPPPGLCIVGKTETENVGIDKIIKNTVANSAISVLMLAGEDVPGHLPGATIAALCENGIDDKQRVVSSPGKRPFLRNVSREEVESFRRQIKLLNHIGTTDPQKARALIAAAGSQKKQSCCSHYVSDSLPSASSEIVDAMEVPGAPIEMDRAGYFVILPDRATKRIVVEHYSYDDRLQHVIRGATARSIYLTIINNGWASKLSHAAYLGKELARAEISLCHSLPYTQDGA